MIQTECWAKDAPDHSTLGRNDALLVMENFTTHPDAHHLPALFLGHPLTGGQGLL